MMMAIIMFSFGGLELGGSPQQKLITRSKVYRKQLTGYLPHPDFLYWFVSRSALTEPWTRVTADTSPFVLIFHELAIPLWRMR